MRRQTSMVAILAILGLVATTLTAAPAAASKKKHAATPTVGSTIKTKSGNTVKYWAYQDLVDAGQFITPTAGNKFVAVDVEGCNKSRVTRQINPLYFTLELANHQHAPLGFGTPGPSLESGPIAPGDCSRGWIGYEIPTTMKAVALQFQPTPLSTELYRWSIP